MRRIDYINHLELKLSSLPHSEVKTILDEVNKKFDDGISKGKTEAEISDELGKPQDYANKYLKKGEVEASSSSKQGKSSSAGAVVFVIFFNLLVGIPCWLALLVFVLSIVGIDLLSVGGAIAVFTTIAFWGPFFGTGILLGITFALSAIAIFAMVYFSVKYYFVFLASYIGWNAKLIREGF